MRSYIGKLGALVALAGVAAMVPAGMALATSDPAIVHVKDGTLRGTVTGDQRTYQGIPYAAPPVGPLRWVSPQPAKPWTGTRDATKPSSSCPQSAGFLGDAPSENEDCLYLNVTTPRHTTSKKLPVMFYVHGGGFYSGSGALYGAQRLADQGDVMVVTFNYRLGVFGFLDHPALDGAKAKSGDYGIEDQQAALRWVRDNASAFGGDPANVTLFGESAGGASTCAHLASPYSAGLFRRAIVQSGPCTETDEWPYPEGNWLVRPRATAETQGKALATSLGCDNDTVKCLREIPVGKLLEATEGGAGYGPAAGGGGVLPIDPATALATGHFNHVPVIHGTTRDEHRLFVAALELMLKERTTPESYTSDIENFFGKEKAAKILARYPLRAYDSPSIALATVWTDSSWGCTALDTDRKLARSVPTYAFEFADENAPWASDGSTPEFATGAFHAGDLQYLFDDEQFRRPLNASQRHLSDQMIRYWTQFAHTGDPNSAATPTWPRFTGSTVQSLDPSGIHGADLGREHQCGFWKSLSA
jgi:para-nitrobenzyl esterase